MNHELHQDVEKILISSEEIQDKITTLSKLITEDYRGKDLLLVGVLKGAFVFMSDLAREIQLRSNSTSWRCRRMGHRRNLRAWSGS